jgi:ParB family chromosome partitioning protein
MPKTRPNPASFFSNHTKSVQAKEELDAAQARIVELEQELASRRQNLLSEVPSDRIAQAVVPISQIERRPYRSRRERDSEKFQLLVESIQTYGFRGSIWVQRLSDGRLRLIAGETRLDAAIVANLTEIPVDIIEVDDLTAVKLSRIENKRRQDLNELDDTEEILYLLSLALEKTREETISILYQLKNAAEKKASIDPTLRDRIEALFQEAAPELTVLSFVTTRLRLLNLPEEILAAYNAGSLTYTKAIELSRIADLELRQSILQKAIEEELTVSEIKSLIKPAGSTVPRSVLGRIGKVRSQIEGISEKSVRKLSDEERGQLKQEIDSLEKLLRQKRKEIEKIEKD